MFIEGKTRSMTLNKKVLFVLSIDHLVKQNYIMGDFNINLINYGSHTETQDYIDAMFQHYFITLINKSTRIKTNTATVIDNIYSNDVLGTNYQLHGIMYTDISDHLPIFVLNKESNGTVIMTRTYNEKATATFKESIDQTTWDDIYASRNPQESYSSFFKEILLVYNKSFPLVKKLPGHESINHGLLWHLDISLEPKMIVLIT